MNTTPTPNSPLPRREGTLQRLLVQLRKTPEDIVKTVHPNTGISYEILGKTQKDKNAEPMMTADTAAVYIGKFAPLTFAEEAPHHTFGFQAPERIYGDEFIKAFLDYGFRHTPPGEKVRVVICPSLGTLLNGKEDMNGAYSLQEEAQRIYTIAALSFSKRLSDLELVAMENMPENKTLFQKLTESVNVTSGEVDIEHAYGDNEANGIKLSLESSALEIAQFLYQATKKNDKLREIFFKMRPAKVREMGYPESSKYYGLTEIAIRLRAILSGQKLHIGAERQDVYDKWIVAIVRGRDQNGQFKDFSELYPLYELFKGKTFETVHINTKNNAFRKGKDRKLAWNRLFIFGAIINCLAIGALGKYREISKTDEIVEAKIVSPTNISPTNLPEDLTNTTLTKEMTMPSQTSPSEADKTPDAGSESR